jgi:hypothetical protein
MNEPNETFESGDASASAPATSVDLESALARLQAALTSLELAAGRRREADVAQADLNEAFAAMQDDRSRLALDLDETVARARRLEAANSEVARRLEAAGLALETMIRDAGAADEIDEADEAD